ncbi:lipase family protein [Deinococcus yavapaiensis]|nr:lipase family protein [Deinococcus yavapaiensis]
MRTSWIRITAAFALLAGSGALAQRSVPNVIASSASSGTYAPAAVSAAGAALYARVNEPQPLYTVRRYDLRLRSTDERGRSITVKAQIFVPDLPKPQSLPVYVLGAGTTGLADNCSPFDENPARQSWGWYQGHLLSYAAQGMIAIMPDYAYFDDPARLQPYFVSNSEARILLDAARAASQFFEGRDDNARPARAVFFSGYSQGGHSSFAAADLWKSYAPDVPVKGLAVFGATTNVATLWREHGAFGPYVVAAYQQYYGRDQVNAQDLLLPNVYAGLSRNALAQCVGNLHQMYSKRASDIFKPDFLQALASGTVGQRWPGVARALRLNNAGMNKAGANVPAFIAQGTTDDIVTAAAQRAFVRTQCGLGRRVSYREYPGINHYQTRQVAFRDALAWIRGVTAGSAAPSSCVN